MEAEEDLNSTTQIAAHARYYIYALRRWQPDDLAGRADGGGRGPQQRPGRGPGDLRPRHQLDGGRRRKGGRQKVRTFHLLCVFCSVSDPFSLATADTDPAFETECRSGSGSNPDPGV
jgi:hypothetical protein